MKRAESLTPHHLLLGAAGGGTSVIGGHRAEGVERGLKALDPRECRLHDLDG
jgi:hypothetical protein